MSSEDCITIDFTLPIKTDVLFDYIIRPENMTKYEGFFLIPGIKKVDSSDAVRRAGTLDKITNTDGSSHESTTDVLEKNKSYNLTLRNIRVPGLKGKLATPIEGFREEWAFHDNQNGTTRIVRTLAILIKPGFLNKAMVTFIIRPQLYFSLLKHHQNVLKALS